MFNSLKLSYQICAKFGMDRAKKMRARFSVSQGWSDRANSNLDAESTKIFLVALNKKFSKTRKVLVVY